jgi:hypothetical protein
MKNPPTTDELRAAWEAMRHRRALQHWPSDFDQVMGDPVRAQCVAIEATAARRRKTVDRYVAGLQTAITQARYLPKVGRQQGHPTHPWPPTVSDLKRAAAGDLDD